MCKKLHYICQVKQQQQKHKAMTISQSAQEWVAFGELTSMQRLSIIQAVGTRTKTGKVKSQSRLRNECMSYFVTNFFNK